MAYRRGRRNNGSILDDALRQGWQFSAVLSVGILLLVYVVLPMTTKNKMLLPVIASFQQAGLLLAFVFAVIAVVKFLQAKRRIDAEAKEQYESAMERVRSEPKPSLKPQAWSLDVLQSIEWKRFEELVAAYFRAKGVDCRTVSHGPDGGVDATLYQGEKRVAVVQCKAWNTRPVGVKPVRELLGVMTHQQIGKGYFMATGGYTEEAMNFAKTQPIILVTGEGMMNAIGRMPAKEQQRLLAIATEGDYTTPTCPSCGIKLILRQSGRGSFWGCTNYPRCKVKIGTKGTEAEFE